MKSIMIITLLFSANTLFAKGKDCGNFDQYTDVSKTEMSKIVATNKATIVDVNTKKSFSKSRIPGAIHYASNSKNFNKVLPKDKSAMVVAYCGGKMCTAWQKAAKAACEMGYTNIRHFSEGITGWNKKG